MKYDVDLQEIDAIRRARNVYEEESALGWWKEMRKRMLSRGKGAEKKREREKGGRGRAEIYASDYYATDATSESCLS